MADLILTAALASAFAVDGTALVSHEQSFETEIGDVKQPDFQPQIKIKRFANAANLSVRYVTDEPADVSIDGDRIVYRTQTQELRFYTDGGVAEGGVLEFEAHFFERPASPVLTFTLQTKGLEIFEQPPLAHENADGSTWEIAPHGGRRERPAHVNGSYAIYAKGLSGDYSALGGLNYQTGKLCHIYRPWAEDAAGTRVWCDLAIDEDAGLLTITIPPAFLESAIYPVLVDPTFGYTTHGGSSDNPANNWIWSKATNTPASSGTVTAATLYASQLAGSPTFNPSIYSDAAGLPATRLANVDSGGTAIGSIAEFTTNISYASMTSGVQYWLGHYTFNGQFGVNDYNYRYDSNGGATELYFAAGGDPASVGWPLAAVTTGPVTNERVTIYETYTASGGGVTTDQLIGVFDQQASGAMVGVQYK